MQFQFFDHFEHKIDDKGRLVLPSAYREAFAGGGFLTLMRNYAGLFTPDGWEIYRRKLEQSGVFNRDDLQVMWSYVSPFQPDSQHRIAIGSKLAARIGLEREVTIVGSASHVAIYPRDRWNALEHQTTGSDPDRRSLDDKFGDLGFL